MTHDYTLYYWPIPFRGHLIRYALAEAGATWEEAGFDRTRALTDLPVAEQPYPFLAPPVLHDHRTGRYISQMPAILMSLARKHGLSADPDLEMRLACDASDILVEITRGHGAQMWDRASWQVFRDNRLPRWMQLHERLVREDPALGRADPMLGDLVLGALWHTMIDRLPPLRPLLQVHAPTLTAQVDALSRRPAIAALLEDWQDTPHLYCAGQIEASLLDMLNGDTDK